MAAEPVTDIDTTAADVVDTIHAELERAGVEFVFAELKGPVKDRLRRYGLFDRIGELRFYPTVGAAVDAYLEETGSTSSTGRSAPQSMIVGEPGPARKCSRWRSADSGTSATPSSTKVAMKSPSMPRALAAKPPINEPVIWPMARKTL